MRNLFIVVVIALVGLTPVAGAAQQQAPAPQPPAGPEQMAEGLNTGRLLAIGAGMIAGAFVLEALAAGDLSVLAGAVVGGLIADWWYNQDNPGVLLDKNRFRTATAPTEARPPLRLAAASTRI